MRKVHVFLVWSQITSAVHVRCSSQGSISLGLLFYYTCHSPGGVGEDVFILHHSQQTVGHFGLLSSSLASLGTHHEFKII